MPKPSSPTLSIRSTWLTKPCTLISAIPNLREHFFAPQVVEVHGVEHFIIGVSATQHNVRSPLELAAFLKSTMVDSLISALAVADSETKVA